MKRLSILPSVHLCVLSLSFVAINLLLSQSAKAASFDLSFTSLAGTINVNPLNKASTGVYRADLSRVGFDITAIKLSDIIGIATGSPGKFSGFDLDAVKISDRLITNAEDVKTLPGLDVFNFTPQQTIFSPGTKRDPGNSIYAHYFAGNDLFGSKDGEVDNSIATLGSFDANAITDNTARGFLSLGEGGEILFRLTQRISTASPLYLYIGEVGNNGEQVRGQVTAIGTISSTTTVPEPASLGALSLIGLYLTRRIRKKKKIA
ncbi:PEP-CTERM sorting domain-containing protein [Nostoc parmelioides]|uniref:PEP-CTERM sorting domain-containing protein n=1 Tax=Nostoc parmelioides FACHB-3921 TaxID=2692909 RepID=A0ABR8BBT0_9NOSO|nr:PEP-CTERM sorting domain-containing protein [Nostoc parmelioides]MBD2251537.1 PEP-CTERM sorting domain-containing protein [Nostoc parmelioides FACHB-3921]